MNIMQSKAYQKYTKGIENKLKSMYIIAEKARRKGLDPVLKTECTVAKDLADLVEGLVGPKGVAVNIRELTTKLARDELAFKIAEEIVYGRFEHMEPEAVAEQAIRTALAIFTEGLTAAPIQGVEKVKIKMNFDRTRYLAIYFAGPIRSAGGTDQALTLVVGDFVRRLLGLDRYKPTEEETSRFIEELRLYERSVSRFQYHVSDEELRKAFSWLPVEVAGTGSNSIEVSSFRNLQRIETNRVRGGALRVVNDGIIGRASKVFTIIKKLSFQGWDWLGELSKKSEEKSSGFMDDVIAGRPIFSFPAQKGGFRLRYGRARNTGLSAVGIHPATMFVLEGFLATGTQLRLELPGKSGVVVPVDVLEAPIVQLKDNSIIRVSVKNFNHVKDNIDKILFLGDILISFGDFLYTSTTLAPSGYVEEWWVKDIKKVVMEKFDGDYVCTAENIGIPPERLKIFLERPFLNKPSLKEAMILSLKLHVPMHPAFTFFWSNLSSIEEISLLRFWLHKSEIQLTDGLVHKIVGEIEAKIKESLKKICLPHKVFDGKIVVENEDSHAFALSLGYGVSQDVDISSAGSVLKAINLLSKVEIREKAPTFVGARMGRPEKAKRREMKPVVHTLFPVGLAGGLRRDIVKAAKKRPTFVELIKRKCSNCGFFTHKVKCPKCSSETVVEKSCPKCGKRLKEDKCQTCNAISKSYQKQPINFKKLLGRACNNLDVSMPKILKGVKGLTNEHKTPEIIEKGILRAKYNLSVYKDGTTRFDATNAPLTHFKPTEIGVSIKKLRQLGYICDVSGVPLTSLDQVCELKIQDVVIPSKAAVYFVQIAAFLDELLLKVYGISPYYNVKCQADLVGSLIIGLAPHTCVGILGRIIGFTDLNVCFAHPIWHSAKRRDCDGDEDALMLALDPLLNFSREYLPARIGGIMDAPLLLIPFVNTKEVQRQAHDFDVDSVYPLEFYEKTWKKVEAKQASFLIDLVSNRLENEAQFEGFNFTVPVSNINIGNPESAYKHFKTMFEKLSRQLELSEKIEAVDAKQVALKVLTTHFMRDIAGNLRAFSTQGFRCKKCNKRFRRLPLRGECPYCGGRFALTVYRGGIVKYLEAAQHLINKYKLPQYYAQRITLIRDEVNAMFENKKGKQISLLKFT